MDEEDKKIQEQTEAIISDLKLLREKHGSSTRELIFALRALRMREKVEFLEIMLHERNKDIKNLEDDLGQ